MADNILTKDRADANLDIAAKEIAGVKHPRNIITDPDGTDIAVAREATMQALLTAAQAIQTAAAALNAKTTAVNTGAIGGTVALDGPTLAALESIQAATGGLTDAELRAAPVPTTLPAVRAEDSPHTSGDSGLVMLAIREDGDIPTANNGDYTVLKLDEEGRLKVASKPASYPDITGDITAIQATINTPVAGGTVAGDVSRASNVMAFCTGTFNTVNVAFEGSLEATGDTNWFSIQAVRSNANTIETTTGNLSAQPAYGWEMSVNALRRVRVRATARTSGTQSWRFVQGTYATEPIPAAQISGTQPVSGTVTSNLSIPNGTIINSAATTNGTVIQGSATSMMNLTAFNGGAAVCFLKLHNSATVTPGTTAVAMTIPLPPGALTQVDCGVLGMRFSTGLCLSITNLVADNDATAIAAGQVKVHIGRF